MDGYIVTKKMAEANAVKPASSNSALTSVHDLVLGICFHELIDLACFRDNNNCVHGPVAREAPALTADFVPVRGRI
jgi:hypothetical protein